MKDETTKDESVIKIRQNAEAHKIKELLCRVSYELPEIYTPEDFKINEDYIVPIEKYSEVKIEIKNRYTVCPIIIKKKGISKKPIETRGWLIEEIIHISSTRDEPEQFDTKDIARVSNFWGVAKAILMNDVEEIINTALYHISESETDAAAFATMELFKNAA